MQKKKCLTKIRIDCDIKREKGIKKACGGQNNASWYKKTWDACVLKACIPVYRMAGILRCLSRKRTAERIIPPCGRLYCRPR